MIFSHVLYQLSYLGTSGRESMPTSGGGVNFLAYLAPVSSKTANEIVRDIHDAAEQRLGVGLPLRVREQARGSAPAQ